MDEVTIYTSSFHSRTAVAKVVQGHINKSILSYLAENNILLNEEKSEGIVFTQKFKDLRVTQKN